MEGYGNKEILYNILEGLSWEILSNDSHTNHSHIVVAMVICIYMYKYLYLYHGNIEEELSTFYS